MGKGVGSHHLADGKYSISDLLDIERLRAVFTEFAEATGFTIGFLNHPEKEILINAGWRDICAKFHKNCPLAVENCAKSNGRLLDKLNTSGELVMQECENGLVDCVTPIMANGRHVATLTTGQFFLTPPDRERFRRQARTFGFEEEEYLRVVDEIPILDREQVRKVNVFLADIAALISELGYAKLELEGKAVRLEQEVRERERAEEALKFEKDRLRSYVDIADVMIVAIGRDQRTILANKKACEVMESSEEEIVGHNWFDLFTAEEDRGTVKLLFEGLVGGDTRAAQTPYEHRMITKAGNRKIVKWHNTVLRDESGTIVATIGSGEDVTDLRAAEEEKQRLLEAAQKTDRLASLAVLAGGIAHDFNNLLSGLFGYVDIARLSAAGTPAEQYLDQALTALDRARGLTQQLLTFSKGGAPIKECAPLVPFIVDTARFALSGAPIQMKTDFDGNLWKCEYDKNQLAQAIDNLTINAVQAMPMGGTLLLRAHNVHLNTSPNGTLPTGPYVRISVCDTGIGIPAEMQRHIFDPFFTTKQKGSGLGLASVYSIIKRHNGHIEVESKVGTGTAFHIYLPRAEGEQAVELPRSQVDELRRGHGTVLIMDDERMVREVTQNMLEAMGYSTLGTSNGQELLEVFSQRRAEGERIEAIILDLTVTAGMGGVETAQRIRALDTVVPVYVASGYADDAALANPKSYGFSGSLKKPFTISDLGALLNRTPV